MRKTWLTLALVAKMALPVLAQSAFSRSVGAGDSLLIFATVQKELKLDDKQKAAIAELQTAFRASNREALEAFKAGDREKGRDMTQKAAEMLAKGYKKFKDSFSSEQRKRFMEIQVQVATKNTDPNIFKHSDVEKALKLRPQQQEIVKETLSTLIKDTEELLKRGGKDVREKVLAMHKEAYEKIIKNLTEEQQKSFKELGGKEFELNAPRLKGRRGRTKDDF